MIQYKQPRVLKQLKSWVVVPTLATMVIKGEDSKEDVAKAVVVAATMVEIVAQIIVFTIKQRIQKPLD